MTTITTTINVNQVINKCIDKVSGNRCIAIIDDDPAVSSHMKKKIANVSSRTTKSFPTMISLEKDGSLNYTLPLDLSPAQKAIYVSELENEGKKYRLIERLRKKLGEKRK